MSTTETASTAPTAAKHFNVPLAVAAHTHHIHGSLAFRRAVYYYQMIWGIFNNGLRLPDPRLYAEFDRALGALIRYFPLDLTTGLTATQVEGWMTNLRLCAQVDGWKYLDDNPRPLVEGYTFSPGTNDTQKRQLTLAFITYCYANGYLGPISDTQRIELRTRLDRHTRRIATDRFIIVDAGWTNPNTARVEVLLHDMVKTAKVPVIPGPPT